MTIFLVGYFLVMYYLSLNLQLGRNIKFSLNAYFRFSTFSMLNKTNWKCSQNLDMDPTCDLELQVPNEYSTTIETDGWNRWN